MKIPDSFEFAAGGVKCISSELIDSISVSLRREHVSLRNIRSGLIADLRTLEKSILRAFKYKEDDIYFAGVKDSVIQQALFKLQKSSQDRIAILWLDAHLMIGSELQLLVIGVELLYRIAHDALYQSPGAKAAFRPVEVQLIMVFDDRVQLNCAADSVANQRAKVLKRSPQVGSSVMSIVGSTSNIKTPGSSQPQLAVTQFAFSCISTKSISVLEKATSSLDSYIYRIDSSQMRDQDSLVFAFAKAIKHSESPLLTPPASEWSGNLDSALDYFWQILTEVRSRQILFFWNIEYLLSSRQFHLLILGIQLLLDLILQFEQPLPSQGLSQQMLHVVLVGQGASFLEL